MPDIIIISSVHKEIGNCNSDELLKIIEGISPEVIFLEALEGNYTKYHEMLFSQFAIYHERLEIRAIQEYGRNNKFDFVPVLNIGLPNEFDAKMKLACENEEYRRLLDYYESSESKEGFKFLNDERSMLLQEKMRELENLIIQDKTLLKKVDAGIAEYESGMIRNIYSYCQKRAFSKAIFLFGAAHLKSIIHRIEEYEQTSSIKVNWIQFK